MHLQEVIVLTHRSEDPDIKTAQYDFPKALTLITQTKNESNIKQKLGKGIIVLTHRSEDPHTKTGLHDFLKALTLITETKTSRTNERTCKMWP